MIFLAIYLCWGLGGSVETMTPPEAKGDCVTVVPRHPAFFTSWTGCAASAAPFADEVLFAHGREGDRQWRLLGWSCGPEANPKGIDT